VLKEQAIEHMANGVISPVTMGNLFAVFIGAQEKIKETINILNGILPKDDPSIVGEA